MRSRANASRTRIGTLAAVLAIALIAAACEGPRARENRNIAVSGTTSGKGGGGGGGGGNQVAIDTSQCTGNPTDGISGNTITLGTSLPQSGLYAPFAQILKGEQAYFNMVNASGGVSVAGKKYTIKLVAKDDAYQANKTLANVQELVNSDHVFALFNVVGTTNNLAIRQLVSQTCVPNLFAATGSPFWGNQQFPFMLGSELVPYSLEIKALVDYLKVKKPNATIAAIYAGDDFGNAYKVSLHEMIKGTQLRIVQEQQYNPELPDTKSQVTSLASSNADVFLLGATLLGCPNSLTALRTTGWKPLVYMSGTCAAKTLIDLSGPGADGVITAAPLLDPAAPTTVAMPIYRQYVAALKPFGASAAPPDSSIVVYGWTTAALMVHLLEKSPKLDRYSVMQAARSYSATGLGFMLPGATFTTSASDWFIGETYHLVQFSLAKKYFVPITPLIDDDGKTAKITPPQLING